MGMTAWRKEVDLLVVGLFAPEDEPFAEEALMSWIPYADHVWLVPTEGRMAWLEELRARVWQPDLWFGLTRTSPESCFGSVYELENMPKTKNPLWVLFVHGHEKLYGQPMILIREMETLMGQGMKEPDQAVIGMLGYKGEAEGGLHARLYPMTREWQSNDDGQHLIPNGELRVQAAVITGTQMERMR